MEILHHHIFENILLLAQHSVESWVLFFGGFFPCWNFHKDSLKWIFWYCYLILISYTKNYINIIINQKLQKMFDMYADKVYNGNQVINNLIWKFKEGGRNMFNMNNLFNKSDFNQKIIIALSLLRS